MGTITSLGWCDHATRLLQYDIYVCTCLLYGGALWGMAFLSPDGDLVQDCMGAFGVFHRRCLWALMGVSHLFRNDILYVVSERVPL